MPNDIHNTRVETLEADDNESFRELVKYGDGSTSVNRFDTEADSQGPRREQEGPVRATRNQSQSQTATEQGPATRSQEARCPRPEASARQNRMSAGSGSQRSTTSSRSRGRKR